MTKAGGRSRIVALLAPAGLVLFVSLATLNSAGYRFGASDQAFWEPAVIQQLHPDFFPRDAALIASQARLTLADDAVAALVRLTGASVPHLFAALYVIGLVLLALAAVQIGRTYYRSDWTTLALVAGLTMRHGIAKTGTNSLEGYFHPRQLAFALGAWALVFFLRGRAALAVLLVMASAMAHPTTAAWFAVWLGTAFVVTNRWPLPVVAAAAAVAMLGGAWALIAGPLAGRLAIMDAEWLATLSAKDYLFPLDWPRSAWLVNLAYPVLIGWFYRQRHAAGRVTPRETGLVAGAAALLAIFLVSLPLNAARVQLAIQLQPARIFWMLDFLASVYVVWGLAEGRLVNPRRAAAVAALIGAMTISRGLYVALREFPDRPVFAVTPPPSDWTRVMAWARTTPPSSHWMADPMHASRYGTSLRVLGERDVLVEASKDQAIGMYDRAVAMRTRDRAAAVGDFQALTPPHARELGSAYDLDYLVTEESLELPLAFSSGMLKVYKLRESAIR